MPRLKAEKVKRIKADLCMPGATQPRVAKKHRVSRSAVSDIATERTHKDVPWPEGGPPKKRPGGQRPGVRADDSVRQRSADNAFQAKKVHAIRSRAPRPIGDYDPTNASILQARQALLGVTSSPGADGVF